MNLLEYYTWAKNHISAHGFSDEAALVDSRKFEECDAEEFFCQYVYVVLNSGMNNQWAEKKYNLFFNRNLDLAVIGHQGKRKAIEDAITYYPAWFKKLKEIEDATPRCRDKKRIEYLDTLPFIGTITKHHLARNLGIDTVKPDRHLVRLANHFGFKKPIQMCLEIQKATNERLGTIDVILWRAANLGGTPCP